MKRAKSDLRNDKNGANYFQDWKKRNNIDLFCFCIRISMVEGISNYNYNSSNNWNSNCNQKLTKIWYGIFFGNT